MKKSKLKQIIFKELQKLQESSTLNETERCCDGWMHGMGCGVWLGGDYYQGSYDCTNCSCMDGPACLHGDCAGSLVPASGDSGTKHVKGGGGTGVPPKPSPFDPHADM